MARVNVLRGAPPVRTYGGAVAYIPNDLEQLERAVLACLLWEDQFYEDGVSIAMRIAALVPKVSPANVAELAVKAREEFHLRHVPLLLVREMARYPEHKKLVAKTVPLVVRRADELCELLAIYWKDNPNQPLANSIKDGLAAAFLRFDEYQLAKWDRDSPIKLRDVMFLVHPKPKPEGVVRKVPAVSRQAKGTKKAYTRGEVYRHDAGQGLLWRKLIAGELAVPDTWEVRLSEQSNLTKKQKWEGLLERNSLGDLALLRNLRNMAQECVDDELVVNALNGMKGDKVLPFRYIATYREAPPYAKALERAMYRNLAQLPKLFGKTIIILDVSGSMQGTISAKSTMTRMDIAGSLGAIGMELCETPAVYATAGNDGKHIHATRKINELRGFEMVDRTMTLCRELGGGGIFLKQVIDFVRKEEGAADRIIVITDEQDCSDKSLENPLNVIPFGRFNYLINVGSYNRTIGYPANWTMKITGFSDAIFHYIAMSEARSDNA
jgi:60 kDa SS-A/Ro ribonucleoprotein